MLFILGLGAAGFGAVNTTTNLLPWLQFALRHVADLEIIPLRVLQVYHNYDV